MLRYLLLVVFFSPFLLSADCCGGRRDDIEHSQTLENDYQQVKEFVNSKRSIPLEEKLNCLTFSGDIRTKWAHLTERVNCHSQRGDNGILFPEEGCKDCPLLSLPSDAFEVEFNFYVDYVFDRAWAVSWLQFNNVAGLQGSRIGCGTAKESCRGSGTSEGICLRKAYMGYNFCTNGTFRLDVEIGRRPMWSVFTSQVQFQSRFDGILGLASYNVCGFMDAYIKGGPFIIDERSHHFGYIGEAGLLSIWDSRFDLIYSLVHWKKNGANRCQIRDPEGCQFVNSQLQINYFLDSDYLWSKTKLYAAILVNHDARARKKTLNEKQNFAWYAGFLIGDVCKEGDWSLNVCYQYVEAQAIPDCDISGIGNGNAGCSLFADGVVASSSRGRGNYQGWRFEGLYGLTNNLAIDTLIEFSSAINPKIGGRHNFSKFRLEAIYAF
ncbi:putative porin [Chlamydiales bacterium]|nr:putative porin [Chlamydiales bacterium]